jgi:hypothetical protein
MRERENIGKAPALGKEGEGQDQPGQVHVVRREGKGKEVRVKNNNPRTKKTDPNWTLGCKCAQRITVGAKALRAPSQSQGPSALLLVHGARVIFNPTPNLHTLKTINIP